MKKTICLISILFSLHAFGQELKSKKDSIHEHMNDTTRDGRHGYHHQGGYHSHQELGGNITLFFKQIFNLSNSIFPTLPYDLTYKYICGRNAFRAGLGFTLANSSITNSTVSTNSQPANSGGPDVAIPTTNNQMNLFYRVGWEHRYRLDRRWSAYLGVDIAGQYGTNNSASSSTQNGLPNNYSYVKNTDNITIQSIGGGPVGGIQFNINKKLSLFTEIPFYFQYGNQKEVTVNYQDQLINNFSGSSYYQSSTNTQTIITKTPKMSLTLPVTLYLALKF